MPYKTKMICMYPGCTELSDRAFCPKHQPVRKDPRDNAKARGYDWQWHKFRNAYLNEPEHQFCALHISPKCSIVADCIDHIVPLEMGGSKYDRDNLQPSCTACNVAKGRTIIRGAFVFGGEGE